jgi:hypothetical protein
MPLDRALAFKPLKREDMIGLKKFIITIKFMNENDARDLRFFFSSLDENTQLEYIQDIENERKLATTLEATLLLQLDIGMPVFAFKTIVSSYVGALARIPLVTNIFHSFKQEQNALGNHKFSPFFKSVDVDVDVEDMDKIRSNAQELFYSWLQTINLSPFLLSRLPQIHERRATFRRKQYAMWKTRLIEDGLSEEDAEMVTNRRLEQLLKSH